MNFILTIIFLISNYLLVVESVAIKNLYSYLSLHKKDNAGDSSNDVFKNVDLFYGTDKNGHMFPGITQPFGMAKVGVDVNDPGFGDSYSGYAPNGVITGISMMHESGTGGAPQYGVVCQLPYTDETLAGDQELSLSRTKKDSATIGRYFVNTPNIDIEFTSGERSGLFKYNFHSGDKANVLVNASHYLSAPKRPQWTQHFVKGSIKTKNNNGYIGQTTIKGGWGDQSDWTIYFCGEFNADFTQVTSFANGEISYNSNQANSSKGDDSMGLSFQFNKQDLKNNELISRVGISFISTDKACANIEDKNFDFDSMVQQNQQQWKNEVFQKFEIQHDNQTVVDQFYTNLYGIHLLPSNRTGENPNWDNQDNIVYYDDFFTIWDTFRTLNPLINIINPTRGAEIVQSLANTYKNDGYAPDARSANQNGRVQGGTNSDIVIADAYVKNVANNVDWKLAYASMVKNAEVAPPYWYDLYSPTDSSKQGRGALPDWLKYGYITRNYTRSVSRTVEYAYDDYAVSVLAKEFGSSDDHDKYLKRSANWQNIWNFDASTNHYHYTGFLQPKNADGSFNYTSYDPLNCYGCYWGNDEYEAKPIEYGWSMLYDMETLIEFINHNNNDKDNDASLVIQRLDDMYLLHGHEKIVDVGNEPSFATPYLYNFINQQYRSVELVRYIMNTYFKAGESGLPGNSDAGSMQSWVIFAMMGIYPIPATTTYLITSPFVSSLTINLENGAQFKVKANNLSEKNIYVQSLKINGKKWNKNWVDHNTLFGKNGGAVEFELGENPVVWETGERPPSPGHYKL